MVLISAVSWTSQGTVDSRRCPSTRLKPRAEESTLLTSLQVLSVWATVFFLFSVYVGQLGHSLVSITALAVALSIAFEVTDWVLALRVAVQSLEITQLGCLP